MCESRVIDMKSSQQHVHSSRRADVKSSQTFLMILKSLQELVLHVCLLLDTFTNTLKSLQAFVLENLLVTTRSDLWCVSGLNQHHEK